jgi:hypothetical protein
MKKRLLLLVTMVTLMLAMAVGPASAQTMTAPGDLFITAPMGGHPAFMMGGEDFHDDADGLTLLLH